MHRNTHYNDNHELWMNHSDNAPRSNQPQHERRDLAKRKQKWMVYEENKQPRNEEEVNRGKVEIFKIMLSVEEIMLGIERKSWTLDKVTMNIYNDSYYCDPNSSKPSIQGCNLSIAKSCFTYFLNLFSLKLCCLNYIMLISFLDL